MKLLIIFNPSAAFGRSVKKLADIEAKFTSLGLKATFMPTTHPGHGTDLVANAELSGFDGLVAAGGDGTVFEVLNGLYAHPKAARIPLGLLPIGTGNAFSRELELQPGAWSDAIDIIINQIDSSDNIVTDSFVRNGNYQAGKFPRIFSPIG